MKFNGFNELFIRELWAQNVDPGPGPVSRRAEEVKVNMQSIKGVNSAPAAMDFDFNKAMVSEESGRAAGAAGCRENRAHAVDSCQALVWGAV